MWRITLLIVLCCSLGLNIYLFIQLNIHSIDSALLSNASPTNSVTAKRVSQHGLENNLNANLNANLNKVSHKKLAADTPTLPEKIKNAIIARDYFLASFLINSLANANQQALTKITRFWLDDAQALINQKLFSYAENSITAFLEFSPDARDFLTLQVNLYLQQKLTLVAIKHAYEIQYHVISEEEKEAALHFARQLVQQKAERLINNNLWIELLEFIDQVTLFDPQNLHLQWMFAQAQFQLAEFEYAKNAVEPLLNSANYNVKAQALLTKIEVELRKPTSIALERQGKHFIVQGSINNAFNVP